MLHLEAAFISHSELQLATAGPWLNRRRIQRAPRPSAPGASHLSLGLGLVSLVAPHGAPPESFVRRWYLAAAMHFHSHAQRVLARYVLTKALVSFPDDGPLLLESGAVAQSEATAGAPEYYTGMRDGLVRAQAERRAALALAERELRHALAADGALVEARVRLGHVLAEAGRPDEAALELEIALSGDPRPYLVYLARLSLGGAHERAGRLDDAVVDYRGAINAYPLGQAARTGLAHALHRLGDHEAAFEVVRASLALGFEGGQADPWWAYGLSQLRPFDVLIASLREEVRQ